MSEKASRKARKSLRGSRNRRRLLAALAVVAVLGASVAVFLVVLTRPLRSRPLAIYTLETVRVGTMEESVTLGGSVHLTGSKAVPSPQEGLVQLVYAKEGDQVRTGDPIAVISSQSLEDQTRDTDYALERKRREYEAYRAEQSLSAALLERAVARSQSAAQEAERAARHQRELSGAGAATQESAREAGTRAQSAATDLEDRRDAVALDKLRQANRVAELEAEIRMLEEKVERNRRDLELCTIRSPADGTVLNVGASRGVYVRRYETVAVIADSSTPIIVARLPDRYLDSVTLGFPATVRLGQAEVPAQITAIGTEVRAQSSGYGSVLDVEVSLLKPAGRLVEGMPANVLLVTGRRPDTLVVRRGPFFGTNQERFVFRVLDREAQRTEVRFGLVTQTEVEILEGLQAGDRIIVSEYTEFITQEEIALAPTEGGVE